MKPATNEDPELRVQLALEEDPRWSQRQICEIVDIRRGSVAQMLKKHRFYPYHI